jgi:hypothetical protein
MRAAMDELRDQVRADVSTPFPPASSPGEPPHLRSGDYQASVVSVVAASVSGKSITGRVGSDSPYARRLEFGFVGVDSLGRNYNQAPRPHLRPALERMKRRIGKVIAQGA